MDTLSTFDEAMKKFGKGGVDGVDAAFIADGLPTPAIGRAMSEKDAKLLAVTRLGEPNALEREDTIPRWTYQSQKEDCPTLKSVPKPYAVVVVVALPRPIGYFAPVSRRSID